MTDKNVLKSKVGIRDKRLNFFQYTNHDFHNDFQNKADREIIQIALLEHINLVNEDSESEKNIGKLCECVLVEKHIPEEKDNVFITFNRHIKNSIKLLKYFSKNNSSDFKAVLLQGESGSGKELLFDIFSQSSPRNKVLKINYGSLDPGTIRSELFGHKKGAFTDANSDKIGIIEQANGGILILDEIDKSDISIQNLLLRTIREQEIKRIGENNSIKIDVQFVFGASSNVNQLEKEGKFSFDLLNRFDLKINIPPMRERKEDVFCIWNYLLKKALPNDNSIIGYDKSFYNFLLKYNWPGNVEEMKRVCKNVVAQHQINNKKQLYLSKELLLPFLMKEPDIGIPLIQENDCVISEKKELTPSNIKESVKYLLSQDWTLSEIINKCKKEAFLCVRKQNTSYKSICLKLGIKKDSYYKLCKELNVF